MKKAMLSMKKLDNKIARKRDLYNHETTLKIVSSATWRSQLGIKGTVREQYKKAAQAYVLNHYGKKASQDESDAICIGSYKLKYNTGFDWDS